MTGGSGFARSLRHDGQLEPWPALSGSNTSVSARTKRACYLYSTNGGDCALQLDALSRASGPVSKGAESLQGRGLCVGDRLPSSILLHRHIGVKGAESASNW